MKPVRSITTQAILGLATLAAILWFVLFLPAGSLDYWQAWTFWLIFMACVTFISAYFMHKDTKLIDSRLKAGPISEQENEQKIIQAFASIFFILLILIPSLDHRFQLSFVPVYLVVSGDAFVVLGLMLIFIVFRENSYTSGIIEVNKGQSVISTGPYGVVRHPMYSGGLLMLLFIPLALGSFLGLLVFPLMLFVIVVRLLEEEKFLVKNLPGYDEYRERVRYRLVPYIW
jgi:protein-S-isoprenylcysteine O-methyltransferase Ste14